MPDYKHGPEEDYCRNLAFSPDDYTDELRSSLSLRPGNSIYSNIWASYQMPWYWANISKWDYQKLNSTECEKKGL